MTTTLAAERSTGAPVVRGSGRGRAPRAQPPGPHRTLPLGPFLVAAVAASTLALTHVVAPGRWLALCAALITVLAVVTGAIRRRTRRPIASAAGAVVALWALAVLHGGAPGQQVWAPTPGGLDRLGDLLVVGAEIVRTSPAPLTPVPAIELLCLGGSAVVFLVAEHLARGRRAPALAGLPLLALWVPAGVIRWALPTGTFVVAAISYLALLAVAHGRVTRPARGSPRALVALTVGATAGALLLGVSVPGGPGWARIDPPGGSSPVPGALDPTPGLSVEMDMRAALGPRSGSTLFTYRSDGRPGPLRLYTVSEFDGRTWHRGGPEEPPQTGVADRVLWPSAIERSADRLVVDVQVEALTADRLPIPLEPRTVEIDGDWRYDDVRDEVVAAGTTTRGLAYRVTTAARALEPEVLHAAGEPDLPDLERYLRLPDSAHIDDVREVAEQITSEATNDYERTLALQSWFRSGGVFRYDTAGTPAHSEDAVWDFLEVRSGYCVQFATAMAVMARAVGVPTRLAVGYLPGQPNRPSGELVVTGEQAHAWPEMYFADVGWVRFEPTPAVQSGPLPAHANPSAAAGDGTVPAPSAAAQPTAEPSTATPGVPGSDSAAEPATGGAARPGLAGLGLVLTVAGLGALLALLTARSVRRRRQVADPATLTPELAWSELRRRLGRYDVRWSSASTPRTAVHEVTELVQRRAGTALGAPARDGLERLAVAVERTRYAPHPETWPAAQLFAWVLAVEAGVAEQLDGQLSDRARRGAAPSAARAGS